MEKTTKKKLLTIDKKVIFNGIIRAKSQKRSFSAYVELLIEKDLLTETK